MVALSAVEQERVDAERDKYLAIWRHDVYRKFSPGEVLLDRALAMLKPADEAAFVDFGIGSGRAANALMDLGHAVIGVDIANNCLDKGLRIPLIIADLARLPDIVADYGLCCDVMEHIRIECVNDVLREIARCARVGTFFSICLKEDAFGVLVGTPLHLTVKPADWWIERLRRYWPQVLHQQERDNLLAVCRHIPDGFTYNIEIDAICNATNDQIFENVRINSLRDDVPWLNAVDPHDGHAVMVGGGPSLKKDIAGIKARRDHGQTIFALNGAASFLKSHGIDVDYQLVLDARPDNVKFLKDRAAKKYLLGSQCHPSLFDELKGEDVTLFHWGMEGITDHLPKGKRVTLLAGSYVLGPIAMSAATVLGYRKLHLYGYDSSDADDGEAHAYAQDETDPEKKRIDVIVAGRKFRCSFGMFKQAETFPQFASMLAEHGCTITVHGDGLLPTVAREMLQQPNA